MMICIHISHLGTKQDMENVYFIYCGLCCLGTIGRAFFEAECLIHNKNLQMFVVSDGE